MVSFNKLLLIFQIGMLSGFTLMISGNTLNYWLASSQLDLKTISLFAFILLPYSINFIWAPILDTVKIKFLSKFLGQRLSWILIVQTLLILSILILSYLSPSTHLSLFAACAFCVSFFSSTQDDLLGILKTELVSRQDQGRVSGVYIFGYRLGMLISGSGAVYLSDRINFGYIYKLLAFLVLLQAIILLLKLKNIIPIESSIDITSPKLNKLQGNFVSLVLRPIGSNFYIGIILLFLIMYRLSDNFISMMINPFVIHIGFKAVEVAAIGKFGGILAAIIGGFIASYVMQKKTLLECLLIFGITHSIAHSLFIILELKGANLPLYVIVTFTESITGGMTMAAYLAFISSLCEGRYRATQYAFFSTMMGFSRAIFPSMSGYIVTSFGWKIFFTFTVFASLPALFLIPLMIRYTKRRKTPYD